MQIATHAITWILSHLRREGGQDLVEYAMLSGLIAAALIAAAVLISLTAGVDGMATAIGNCIDFDPIGSPC